MKELDGFDHFDFDGPLWGSDRTTHPVYHRGDGPPVIIWQELPGIGPQTISLANWLVDNGFRVYMPHLFGPLGQISFAGNIVRVMCMRREFHLFARGKSSPITRWMAALCAEVSRREGGAKLGTIGMCLTGNFALTMMAEPDVIAGVASQPSLPLAGARSLHMSDDEIAAVRKGVNEKGHAVAMRYKGDPLCAAAKMDRITQEFGDGVQVHQFEGKQHSLLTMHPNDKAFDTVLGYLRDRLQA